MAGVGGGHGAIRAALEVFARGCKPRWRPTPTSLLKISRLSPRDTNAHTWKGFAGIAKSQLGSWDQAVMWFRRAIEANRSYPHPYFVLGAALAQLGRLDEAHSAVKAGLALNPAFAISAPAPSGRR